MTDPLITAWNLLTPEERDGLWHDEDGWHEGDSFAVFDLSGKAARRWLIVACEGKALRLGLTHEMLDDDHVWGRFPDVYGSDPDRLTAAVMALQAERAERGTDAK